MKNQILSNSKEQCDVTYYLPCYDLPENPIRPCTTWLPHQETQQDLSDKFISAAQKVNVAISHSKKYMDALTAKGLTNVVQIVPGVDLQKFSLRASDRLQKDKLIVGYVGRQFSATERKNPKLLERISKLPFVEFKATGGRIREADLPRFYSSVDLVVSAATNEGGPMAIIEALAVGTPIMCFADVGMSNEFWKGVVRIPFADDDSFITSLETFWNTKEYLQYRKYETMKALRKQVELFSWEHFATEHDKIWEKLNKE